MLLLSSLSITSCFSPFLFFFFFFNDPATTEIYTLSLHDALPISFRPHAEGCAVRRLLHSGWLFDRKPFDGGPRIRECLNEPLGTASYSSGSRCERQIHASWRNSWFSQ